MKFPMRIPGVLLALLAGCDTGLPEGDWDNPHDPAGTAFFPPLVDLRDTAIRDGENGVVQSFVRPQVAPVDSCRWILDGEVLPTGDCSIPTKGWALGNHAVIVQASDTRGIASLPKTVNVWIGNQPPRLAPIPYRRQSSLEPLVVDLLAEDPDGAIVSVAWDTAWDRYANASTRVRIEPSTWGGNRTVWWRAIDDDGKSTDSSFTVGLVPPPTVEVSLDFATIGYATAMNGVWTVRARDNLGNSIPLGVIVTVSMPSFPDEPFGAPTVTGASGTLTCGPPSTDDAGRTSYRCGEKSDAPSSTTGFRATATNRFGAEGSGGLSVLRN